MKRAFDFLVSLTALVLLSPILIPVCVGVWLQDFKSPFYIAPRVGRRFQMFKMVKIRSMVVNADKTGVASTSNNDMRITKLGRFIRKCKLDEISQLWNVLLGEMSLVGPRPNVKPEVDKYTPLERGILKVKPGITDFASIVFADEGSILADSKDPDLDYNLLIRPWKSRLALFYIQKQSFWLDSKLIAYTVLTIFARPKALRAVSSTLAHLGAEEDLVRIALRKEKLEPQAPPGQPLGQDPRRVVAL